MKKKISILTLAALFLVSTTGLPVFSHYCEMMGKLSSESCEMCEVEKEEIISCCSEDMDTELRISSLNSSCCIEQFDYKKIDENLFTAASFNIVVHQTAALINVTFNDSKEKEFYLSDNNFNLPPPKFGKQLLKTIHQLKIALPVV